MTRVIPAMLLLSLLTACGPNTAEVSCGANVCAANQRCEPTTEVCVLDEAPKLHIDEPAPNAIVPGDTLTLRGSVQDDAPGATLELSIDDGHSWVKLPLSSGRFDVKVALPVLDSQPFSLSLRAHDSHLQAAATSVRVTVDNVAPQVTLTSPTVGAKLNAAWFTNAGTVTGLAMDGSPDLALTVDVGAGPISLLLNSGQFSEAWTANPADDGAPRVIRVTAKDAAGNQTVVETAVTVDVVPPSVGILAPAANALLGAAFFQGGGLLQGRVSPGSTVTVGAASATVTGGQWSFAMPMPGAVDYQPQVLDVTATDDAGNASHASRIVMIDVVPPVLAFSSPAPGMKLNAAAFAGTDDVTVAFVVSDGDAQTVVRSSGNAVASPLKVTTSPMDNPKGYTVALTAEDRAGNSASASLSFAVDRVRPTVTARGPADGSRNNLLVASIDFSEAVFGGDGLSLSPAVAGGAWTSSSHFEISGLPADSVFTTTAGPVADAFGNPAVLPAATRFHTAPKLAVSGSTIATDVWHFKAAADRDGVLSVFTTSQTTPAGYRWIRVNPKTGQVEDQRTPWLPTLGSAFSELDVSAWSVPNPDLSARRISGAMTLHPGTITERRVWSRLDDGVANSDLGMVGLIPTPAFSAEGLLGELGELRYVSASTSAYTRQGLASDLDTGIAAPTAIGYGDKRWELVESRGGTMKRRSFGCFRQFANQPTTCQLTAVQQWADVASTGNASTAMSDSCTVAIYDTSSGSRVMHVEPYAPVCLGVCPSAWSTSQPLATELRVAVDRRESNTFVGAERTATGVQLKRLTLSSGCAGSWTDVGSPVAVPAGSAFEPVSLGGQAALLYVDTGFVLKVLAP
jgi:hypothetical protein